LKENRAFKQPTQLFWNLVNGLSIADFQLDGEKRRASLPGLTEDILLYGSAGGSIL